MSSGIEGLSKIVSGANSMERTLVSVADMALKAVSAADGAGVTMLETGVADTIVASAGFVRDVDSIQYRLGEGPCISAADSGSTRGSGNLALDASWPTFGPLAADLGIHSALSLPMLLDGEVIGALNMYAHSHDAFTGESRRTGELFATSAAVVIHNARLLDQLQRETQRMQRALTSRATIDQAIGIIMARTGVSADEGFVRLRILSQRDGKKVHLVAQTVVDEAVRRARARRVDPPSDVPG
jgi:GAF domain-containing protein